MIDIFELAGNDKFFHVLALPHKHLYWSVVDTFYQESLHVQERRISRMEMRGTVERLMEEYNETAKEVVGYEPHEIIKTFIDDGWFTTEYDGSEGADFIYMTPFATDFMKNIYAYRSRSDSVQADNYLELIMSLTKSLMLMEVDYPYRDGLCRIRECINDAIHNLGAVDQRTKKNMADILAMKNMQDLIDRINIYVDDLLSGYLHHVYEHAYINESQKQLVLDMLQFVSTDVESRERIFADMRRKYLVSGEHKTDEELERELEEIIYDISKKIRDTYPAYQRKIDNTKRDIIERAMSKIDVLTAGNTSYIAFIDKIVDCLNALEDSQIDVEDLFERAFNMQRTIVFDEESLYTKKDVVKHEEIAPVEQMVFEVTEEYEREIARAVCSVADANRYANVLLCGLSEVSVCDLECGINIIEQLEMLCCFADHVSAEYDIIPTGDKIIKENCEMDVFVIRRK